MNPTDIATSGPLLLAALISVAAGTISFASPCVIPLVPGYLAYLAGLVGADAPTADAEDTARRRADRWRVAGAALLFVLGFAVVFGAAVLTVLGVSDALLANEQLLQRLGGVVTIFMGLAFLGFIRPLQRDARLHHRPRRGIWGAPVLGAVFGLGWTPCLGPTLAGVIALASGTQAGPPIWRGLILVTAYCLGLGLPFVLLALSARWAVTTAGWLKTHTRAVQITGGVLLLAVGALLVTGLWGDAIAWLRGPISGFSTPL
ncbi:cytochrome c biogenesis CcdA family protein [Amycolatopsis roodepoortensis]|uniref:cytochrome c biogenesis CcdA family protein n=1 Tax=Amycolatopsis roodepoortensis TaxID=700274 RepID=UPI00214CED04|nr:cytochrome c biogenesis CcdA family protein [Amycolatopsis roodepoortensis]UUV35876.1 cytochrome c biogenesis CcdA family protein [Amycolatopsis roodepoortensis]